MATAANNSFYSNAACAPRYVLMTGLHMGHCWVRGNANNQNKQTLQPGEITVPGELKKAGYATALFDSEDSGNSTPLVTLEARLR